MDSAWMRPYLNMDPDFFFWSTELDMMADQEAGDKLHVRIQMTREYFEELVWLMVAQMDSEFVGAYGYMPIPYIAPVFDAKELRHVPQIVHDEFIHGNRIRDCLMLVGFDADKWIEDHQSEYNYRVDNLSVKLAGRPTKDFRVNIFYYPIVEKDAAENNIHLPSWINFTIFQFLQDRGAGEQLRDAIDCNFEPWAHENTKIMREENRHIEHCDRWMEELFDRYGPLVQERLQMWWPLSIATFGKPESERNETWRRLGLKQRTNEQVLRDFLDGPNGVHAANAKIGLRIPSTDQIIAKWRVGDYSF